MTTITFIQLKSMKIQCETMNIQLVQIDETETGLTDYTYKV